MKSLKRNKQVSVKKKKKGLLMAALFIVEQIVF